MKRKKSLLRVTDVCERVRVDVEIGMFFGDTANDPEKQNLNCVGWFLSLLAIHDLIRSATSDEEFCSRPPVGAGCSYGCVCQGPIQKETRTQSVTCNHIKI